MTKRETNESAPTEMTIRLMPVRSPWAAAERLKLFQDAGINAEPGEREPMGDIVIAVVDKDNAMEVISDNNLRIRERTPRNSTRTNRPRRKWSDEGVVECDDAKKIAEHDSAKYAHTVVDGVDIDQTMHITRIAEMIKLSRIERKSIINHTK